MSVYLGSIKSKGNTTNRIKEIAYVYLNQFGMYPNVSDIGNEIIIEPDTRKTGRLKSGSLDGMQIIYDKRTKNYEVSEYQAGKNQNELHVFKNTKYLKTALDELMKGNNRRPIKIYK
jgi:hypothetical protein